MSGGVGLTEGKVRTNLGVFSKCIGKNLTDKGRKSLYDLYAYSPRHLEDSKWCFNIPEATPVRFISGQPGVADELHPEFFGYIMGPGRKWAFSEYSICFRVWSSNKRHNYWQSTDSELAHKTFLKDNKPRLLLRLRFDLHEKKEGPLKSHHPWFHMQIGGKSRAENLNPFEIAPEGHYRYPPGIDTPRIPSFPMSFILLGRFILANYHPIEYKSLCAQNDKWKSLIAKEEKLMWEKYIKELAPFITANLTLESCFERIGMDSKLGWT